MTEATSQLILQKLGTIETNMLEMKTEINGIKDEMSGLKSEFNGMKGEMSGLKSEFNGIKGEMSGLKSEFNGIKGEMSGLKSEFNGIKGEMSAMKAQLDENTEITKAIHHRQSESDAKLEGFSLDFAKLHEEVIATKDSVVQLTEDQKSTNEVIGEHEISIRSLRRRSV